MAGSPEVLELQRQANRFRDEVGFSEIREDGVISDAIVDAVVRILKFYAVGGWSSVTRDTVATDPTGFADRLRALADTGGKGDIKPPDIESLIAQAVSICRAEPNDPRCKNARTACARGGLDPAVATLCANLTATKSSNVVWWVVGGAAAVALAVGYAIYARRKPEERRPSFAGNAPRRRRRLASS